MIITVRKAAAADVPVLVAFNQAMALETENKRLATDTVTAGVRALIERPQYGFYLLAETDKGEIAGSLMITSEWSDWRNGLFWWVQSVYVPPEHRRQGIYRRLYQYAQTLAEDEDENDVTVCGFRLYVERDNLTAQQTYRALGMSETPYKLFEALAKLKPG